MGLLKGRVAIGTGAGRGIGREEAIALAREGAKVVVNEPGGGWKGTGSDNRPADEVVEEIRDFGGEAVANFDNVADEQGARDLIRQAIDTFGDVAYAKETVKYGVTVNAIAPRARTRLTTTMFEGTTRACEFAEAAVEFDAVDPANIAPFAVFLTTDHAATSPVRPASSTGGSWPTSVCPTCPT
jgi:NAD(P)-dependent dehydrogenase (short-subunit alcohol dehydrogenase family)